MICRRRRLCKYSPAGTNFYKVLQEGKSCYKIVGAFSMVPHRASGYETIWTLEFNNVPPIIAFVNKKLSQSANKKVSQF